MLNSTKHSMSPDGSACVEMLNSFAELLIGINSVMFTSHFQLPRFEPIAIREHLRLRNPVT